MWKVPKICLEHQLILKQLKSYPQFHHFCSMGFGSPGTFPWGLKRSQISHSGCGLWTTSPSGKNLNLWKTLLLGRWRNLFGSTSSLDFVWSLKLKLLINRFWMGWRKTWWSQREVAEELCIVLWTLKTTPKKATGKTPLRLVYEIEGLLPIKNRVKIICRQCYEETENKESMLLDL